MSDRLRLNPEFTDYRWVSEEELASLELNSETVDTLARLGPWGELSRWEH